MSNVKELKNVIGLLIVAMIIIILYLGMLSSIVFCLSLISFLGIKIFSFLMDIRIKNRSTKNVIELTTIIVNYIGFTIYMIWLDSHIDGIHFSNTGLVCYIILVAILVYVININGDRLKKSDTKQKK
jgi:hypothetical protein